MNNMIILRLSLFLLLLMFQQLSVASIDVYEFDNEQKRLDFTALTKELRCPKCQNQDIADSNAPIAADMRKEVHRLLEEGKDKESIVNFMIDRFGEFVTYKPKKSTETFMLWYGPWILVFIGLIVILSLIKLNKKKSSDVSHIEENNSAQLKSSDEITLLLNKYDNDKQ